MVKFRRMRSATTRTGTSSLRSGSTGATYQITAVRSTRCGLPGQFNVNFGVGGDGLAFVTVSGDGENATAGAIGSAVKMAA